MPFFRQGVFYFKDYSNIHQGGSMNNFTPMGNTMFSQKQFPTNNYLSSTSTNNIVWVQGIEGAKAWQLAPNSMVILLDSEVEGKMYIKVSDNIGMCSLRIFSYVEELPSTNNQTNDLDLSQYVKKDELIGLIKEILNNNEQPISTAQSTTGTDEPEYTISKAKIVSVPKK